MPIRSDSSDGRRIMSSMHTSYGSRWNRLVVTEEAVCKGGIGDLIRQFRLAQGRDGIILLGAVSLRDRYRDLILAAILKFVPARRRPRILITDATWEPQSRALARKTRLPASFFGLPIKMFIRMLDAPNVHYAVLSRAELATFPRTWGVPHKRVVYTPYPATINADTEYVRGHHMFAGGNSLRDYVTLAAALRMLDGDDRPGMKAVVATSAEPPVDVAGLSWVTWRWQERKDYDLLLAKAAFVLVPLEAAMRSGGQQTYLNAMLLEKPVIVSDVPGVRDYIDDGRTGVIVPAGDAKALHRAIADVLDPGRADFYEQMGRDARASVLSRKLNLNYYFDHTLLDALGVPSGW